MLAGTSIGAPNIRLSLRHSRYRRIYVLTTVGRKICGVRDIRDFIRDRR